MTAIENSVMTKKVKCTTLDLTAYPHLDDLTVFVGQSAAQVLAEMCSLHADPAEGQASISEGDGTALNRHEHAAFYTCDIQQLDDVILLQFSSQFLRAFAENRLGGEFELKPDAGEITNLEKELGKAFPEEIAAQLNSYFIENSQSQGAFRLGKPVSVTDAKKLKKIHSGALSFNMTLFARVNDGEPIEIAAAHLPIALLENLGLLEQDRIEAGDAPGNAKWNKNMEANLQETEIELDITIDQYTANLADISRLEVGTLILLAENCQNDLDISLVTRDGPVSLGRARLGTFKKKKAVKLSGCLGVGKS